MRLRRRQSLTSARTHGARPRAGKRRTTGWERLGTGMHGKECLRSCRNFFETYLYVATKPRPQINHIPPSCWLCSPPVNGEHTS